MYIIPKKFLNMSIIHILVFQGVTYMLYLIPYVNILYMIIEMNMANKTLKPKKSPATLIS